jgi:hypothetical protein
MVAKFGFAAASLATSVGFAQPASAHEWRRFDRDGYYRHAERERWEQMRRHRWMEAHERRLNYDGRYYVY